MARKRIMETCELRNWEDVDLYLAEISENERSISKIESDMQKGIDELKLAADIAAKSHKDRIAHLEGQISLFVDSHKEDLGGKKTKVLTFGQLGYRKSTSVKLPSDKEKLAAIIERLKSRGMHDCVVTPPEKVDKEKLKKYPEDVVSAVGATLKVKDVFWYEIAREKLAEGVK
ncbi:MAG: host-nuclease inhibitor Gam family protein [Burkholderiales bacterium]